MMKNLRLPASSNSTAISTAIRPLGLGDFAIFVPPAEAAVGTAIATTTPATAATVTEFVCYGLGSCVALVLADPRTGILAVAHVVLPQPPGGVPVPPLTRYATSALPFLVERMLARGARRDRLVAWLVGGAQVLDLQQAEPIGARNVEVLRQELRRLEIPVVAEAVGGTSGRTLRCYPQRGLLVVSQAGRGDEVFHDGSLFDL